MQGMLGSHVTWSAHSDIAGFPEYFKWHFEPLLFRIPLKVGFDFLTLSNVEEKNDQINIKMFPILSSDNDRKSLYWNY